MSHGASSATSTCREAHQVENLASARRTAAGPAAGWPSGLGKGLQSPVRGFDSRSRLAKALRWHNGESTRAIGAVWLARFLDTEEVTGSSPVSPTQHVGHGHIVRSGRSGNV